eukprot:g3483.t1
MRFFRCQTIVSSSREEVSYLQSDYSLHCGDGQWTAMLGVVISVLTLFSFGMPITIGIVLFCRRKKLRDQSGSTFRFLGMLYNPYNLEHYYFEPVQMIFKLLLWMALVFFPDGDQFQHAAILFICFIQVVAHARLQPFNTRLKNTLQYLGLAFMTFASFAGLVLNFLRVSRSEAVLRQDIESSKDLARQTALFETLVDATTIVFLGVYGAMAGMAIRRSLKHIGKLVKLTGLYLSYTKIEGG